MTVDGSRIDLLVLVGPGVGHVVPVLRYLEPLVGDGLQAVVVTHAAAEERVAAMCQASGVHYRALTVPMVGRAVLGRTTGAVHRRLRRSVLPALARREAWEDAGPGAVTRTVFSALSYSRPDVHNRPQVTDAIQQLVRRMQPQMIMADGLLTEAAQAVARREQLPLLRYWTGPGAELGAERPPFPAGLAVDGSSRPRWLDDLGRAWLARRHRRLERVLDRDARACSELLPPLVFSVPELDRAGGSSAAGHTYVGPCLGSLPSPDAERRPTVFATFGSTGRPGDVSLVAAIAEAADSVGMTVVLQTQEPVPVRLPGLEIVQRSAGPRWDLLGSASVVASHGGHNTVVESLTMATPVLLFPDVVADRLEVARRVHEAGVGVVLDPYRPDVAAIAAALSALRSTGVADQASRLANELRAEQPAAVASRQIIAEICGLPGQFRPRSGGAKHGSEREQ